MKKLIALFCAMAETQAVMATNAKIRILFIISYKKVVMNSEKR